MKRFKRFRNIFCPRCLRANRDTPGDEEQGAQGLSDFFPVDTGSSIDDEKLQNLQKQLDIEMRVKEGAEKLLLAYNQDPITNQKILNNVQQMHEDCMKKIQVLSMQILQAKKKSHGPDVGPELDESPEKDMEPILEPILEQVFQLATDTESVPALEESPQLDNIMVSGPELDESPQKDTEAILETILERVFQLVTDSVPVPALEEASEMDNIIVSGQELDESPEKDMEAILESILEQVFQLATDTESVPALEGTPQMDNIMVSGPELDESPQKDTEAILETILERVFQLVTDSVPIPALEEVPEMNNIMVSGLELDESPEKDMEAILESILEQVFQLATDTESVPALEETPQMDNIMVSGPELDESPQKDTEAILETILERVFQLVTDSVPIPALEEVPEMNNIMVSGLEPNESPEKDTEAIVEIILERVFQSVTDTESAPALEEASEMESVSVSQVDKQIQDLPSSGHQSPICVLDLDEEQEVHPAPPETPKQGPDMESEEQEVQPAPPETPIEGPDMGSPEKDIEAIVESILEQVFEMVTDASSVPALADAPEEEIENVSEAEVDKQIQDLPSSGMQSQRKIGLQDFRCCAVLGRGSYGKVLLAEYKKTGQMVALKAMKKKQLIAKRRVHRLMSEKETFVTISSAWHPFLINLFASFQTETHTIFAMEYAAGGDLETHLNNTPEGFPKPRAVFYAACVILGVECLHRHNIVHRDLKAENIVLDQEGFAKITDFGLCKSGMGYGDRAISMCGSLPYLAPEILTDNSYTRAVDWWSVGALIYAMLVGRTPFTGDTEREIINNIVHTPVRFPKNLSKKGTALLRLLLDKNPTSRLGASEKDAAEVKEHRFFRRINWTKLLDQKMTPPFLPSITSPEDVSNFSKTMTSRAPVLTPPRGACLTEDDQEPFEDFDWIAE